MPTPGEQPRVFLSHSWKDKPLVRFFAKDLRSSKCLPWLDEVEMKTGDSLVQRISDAVKRSDYVIAFLSKTSIRSAWVQHELQLAATLGILRKRVTVLPVVMPGVKDREIPAFLIGTLYCDLRKPAQYDEVVRNLLRRLTPSDPSAEFLTFTANRSVEMLDAAQRRDDFASWAISYLAGILSERPDPSERYWIYLTAAKLRHDDSKKLVEAGLLEADRFARQGAEEALNILKRSNNMLRGINAEPA